MSKKEVSQSNNEVKGDLAGNDVNKPTYNIGRTSIGGKSQLEKLYDRLEKERVRSFCPNSPISSNKRWRL